MPEESTRWEKSSKRLVRASVSGDRVYTSRQGVEPPAYPSPLRDLPRGRWRPTNARAAMIYSADGKAHMLSPTGRLADSVSSTDSSIALLSLLGAMMPPVSSRSLRTLSSTSASGLLGRLCLPFVSSPMAKYASCSRAQPTTPTPVYDLPPTHRRRIVGESSCS